MWPFRSTDFFKSVMQHICATFSSSVMRESKSFTLSSMGASADLYETPPLELFPHARNKLSVANATRWGFWVGIIIDPFMDYSELIDSRFNIGISFSSGSVGPIGLGFD